MTESTNPQDASSGEPSDPDASQSGHGSTWGRADGDTVSEPSSTEPSGQAWDQPSTSWDQPSSGEWPQSSSPWDQPAAGGEWGSGADASPATEAAAVPEGTPAAWPEASS